MKTAERRYDIDWLRVIAIGLLLIYHIGIGFQPWGVFIGFIQCDQSLKSLWPAMALLNVWRIPLLFFVSGMGVGFAIKRRSWKQLLLERTRRILLPLIFGALAIVPVHILLWQKYYSQDLSYTPGLGHLWFLANIFIYVLVLSPLFFYLKRKDEGRLSRWIRRAFWNPLGFLIMAACFVLEAMLVGPDSFATYAMNLHGFILGLIAFLFGFLCIHSGKNFWLMVRKWRWPLLAMAVGMYLVRYLVSNLEGPNYLAAIESCAWIFAVLGFANKYLNHPSNTLSYLSQGAYPIYILHMIFLYLASYLLFPLEIPGWLKFFMAVAFTGAGCFISYELIRRVRFIRTLFGLK
jgi:peptidoglycan/LPS O-acetylase OafA/YrhL